MDILLTDDIDENQRHVLRTMMPQASPAFIEDLVNYVAQLRGEAFCTQKMAEMLLLRRIKDKMGASYDPEIYDEIPEELRNIQ